MEAGMDLPRSNDGEARFSVYVEGLTSVIGHADELWAKVGDGVKG
jgi:hypothetical protein